MTHTFLSDDWFDAVEGLLADAPAQPGPASDTTINVVVAGGPEGDREVHMAGGRFERGLADAAPTKLTVPYEVARPLFVDGNQQAAMQAFMSGQIKIEGDMTKVMAMQAQQPTPEQTALQEKVRALTS